MWHICLFSLQWLANKSMQSMKSKQTKHLAVLYFTEFKKINAKKKIWKENKNSNSPLHKIYSSIKHWKTNNVCTYLWSQKHHPNHEKLGGKVTQNIVKSKSMNITAAVMICINPDIPYIKRWWSKPEEDFEDMMT